MSASILETTTGKAVLTNSSRDWVYGPIFSSADEARAFVAWLGKDPQDLMLDAILAGTAPDQALDAAYKRWQVFSFLEVTDVNLPG
jgi:hypothetical protein